MTGRAAQFLRGAWFLTRLVLATVSFVLVGITVFVVAFGAAAIVTPASSYDAVVVIGLVCGLAGGSLAAPGVWHLSTHRQAHPTNGEDCRRSQRSGSGL